MAVDDLAFDPQALAEWLDAEVPGASAPLGIARVSGGASNLTYRVDRAGQSYALRCPTTFRNDGTANTLLREITLLTALAGSGVPHARLVAADPVGEILGVPAMLTGWIEGFAPRAPLPDAFQSPEYAGAFARELTDALAGIGSVDYVALGLTGFGKPEGFLERQVGRWKAQLERAHSRAIPGVDELCDALASTRPETQRSSLIHGDYQFINTMFAPASPPKLAAVIDWETATIGDPLLDLGWMLAGWQEPGEAPTHASYMDWRDMPGRAQVAEWYAASTGLDVSRVDYYIALALFKLAAIMEGWHLQYVSGRSHVAEHAALERMVPNMIERALAFVSRK